MTNSQLLLTRQKLRQLVFLALRIRQIHVASPSSVGRQHDDESRNVRVSVWWDFENCNIPSGVDVYRVGQAITNAVRSNSIRGPIQITAFGDVLQLSRAKQEALSSSGISIMHVPDGGKNSADRSLLVDLMYWVSQNRPPAHLFLISGDRNFAGILHRLRMNNYNILLASPESAPGVLCSAATIMWHWNSLVRGENLAGKLYNSPPDGPYGSWYGHSKALIEDPYIGMESSCTKSENIHESCSEKKPSAVPASVVKQIQGVLRFFPQGISMTDLRLELDKQNVSLDKNFYGHKKFSQFLLSMPQVLKLYRDVGGQYFIRSITQKHIEAIDQGRATPTEPSVEIRENKQFASRETSNQVIDFGGVASGNHAAVSETNMKVNSGKMVEELTGKANEKHRTDEMVTGKTGIAIDKFLSTHVASQEQKSASDAGLFKQIWSRWFGPRPGDVAIFKDNDNDISQGVTAGMMKYGASTDGQMSPLTKSENSEGMVKSSSNNISPSPATLLAFSNHLSDPDGSQKCRDEVITSPRPNIFQRFVNLCRFQRSDVSDNSTNLVTSSDHTAKVDHIFSSEVFWDDMKSFLDTSKGSSIVSQCQTREVLAQQLQKAGPADLLSLKQDDLLRLVDVLISESKLIKEKPSLKFPFMLTKSCSQPPYGLSGFFRKERSPRPLENDEANRHKSIAHTGVSPPPSQSEHPFGRSRRRTLADCQVLVKEIIQRNTGGCYIGSFRKLFLDRYGYALDLQSLGYQNLSLLLEDMPGVTVRSTFFFSSEKTFEGQESDVSRQLPRKVIESPNFCRKDDETDSTWEELGPVAKTSLSNIGHQTPLKTESSEQETKSKYEAVLSDDDLSDSKDELTSTRHGRTTQNSDQDDCSLLRILDSWYGKEESRDGVKGGPTTTEEKVESSSSDSEASNLSHVLSEETSFRPHLVRKQNPQRTISFVADSDENAKDKLIDGILGSLKISSEAKMQG